MKLLKLQILNVDFNSIEFKSCAESRCAINHNIIRVGEIQSQLYSYLMVRESGTFEEVYRKKFALNEQKLKSNNYLKTMRIQSINPSGKYHVMLVANERNHKILDFTSDSLIQMHGVRWRVISSAEFLPATDPKESHYK